MRKRTRTSWTDVLLGRRYRRRRAVERQLEEFFVELDARQRAVRRACYQKQRRHERRKYTAHGTARSIHAQPDPPDEEYM